MIYDYIANTMFGKVYIDGILLFLTPPSDHSI